VKAKLKTSGTIKAFDLNIEKILEDWEIHHAIREVIANALDEQMLTGTMDIDISKDSSSRWHIRDFGRGLRYEHLTQKENDEKLRNPQTIGKFGIGLKDALATFERHGVKVTIKSKYGEITLGRTPKHGFEDIMTLHAYVAPPSDPKFIGTEFVLDGVKDDDMEKAKDLFLKFSGESSVEKTNYGEVLRKKGTTARIYINGVKVAEEENFLFSYNITSLNEGIKKALNRERSNVGRTAYSGRVREILTSCKSKDIANALASDLKNYDAGNMHDELKWIDVQEHAVKILNSIDKVVFFTPNEMITETMMVDEAERAGYRIVTIPENLKERIRGLKDVTGKPIRDMQQFFVEYDESFEFKFVQPDELLPKEKEVFSKTDAILKLVGGKPKMVKQIRISETMKKQLGSFVEADGLWQEDSGDIIVKRSTLRSLHEYAGTLIHEVAHAISGADDVSREFELELTRLTGLVSSKALESYAKDSRRSLGE
jgi:hypothetical protein